VALGPAQVHAQQHLGPVLGLGAAGAGLDVDETVGRVHLAGEHAAELEAGEFLLEAFEVRADRIDGLRVVFLEGQIEEVPRVREALVELLEDADDPFEFGAFAAEGLRLVRVVPDRGFGEFEFYFGEPILAVGIVKDTP
jgi:hypothetical protein